MDEVSHVTASNTSFEASLTSIERSWPWVLRTLWLLLPFTVGAAFASELTAAEVSSPVRVVLLVLAWAWWVAGFFATVVAHPAGLVVLRCAGPVALAGAAWVAVSWTGDSGDSRSLTLVVVSASIAVVVVAVVLHAETGHWCVNGPAYANERRFLLRPPALLLVGPIPLAGALVAAGIVIGPSLVAADRVGLGLVVSAAGLFAAGVSGRALYAVARRFVVFVPAGLVVHDRGSLHDPVLFGHRIIEGVRAASADSDSLDLTANAPGLVVEVVLTEKVEVTRVRNARDSGQTGRTGRFLIVPTLPGRLLATAASRGLPVG